MDGVGGWIYKLVDTGKMTKELTKHMYDVYKESREPESNNRRSLHDILDDSVRRVKAPGSTTCVMAELVDDSTLNTCNLGDSGYMILRQGEVIFKSESQQHRFNMPYQIASPTHAKPLSGFPTLVALK